MQKRLRTLTNTHAMGAIWRWSKAVHGAILLICGLGIAGALMSLGMTMVTKNLIDSATGKNWDALIRNAVAMAVIIAAERGMGILSASIRMRANTRLQVEMQRMVTERLLSRDYAAIKPYHSGELTNRVFSDVGVIKNGVMTILPNLARTAVSFIGAAAILIGMDWRFVPVMMICAAAGSGISIAFRGPMKRRHKRMQAAEDALHSRTQETLENIRVVKASVSEERSMARMEESREKLQEEQIRNGRLSILMNNGMGSMFDLSWLLCYIWGCLKIFRGKFTYGSLGAMIQLVGRIQSPIASAVQMMSQIYGVAASAERLQEVIDLPEEVSQGEMTDFDRIELKDVGFQYDDGIEEVLEGVNGVIRKGAFIAVTGRSGGGKTSLFQLLLGMYRPTEGTITFVRGEERAPASRGTRGLFAYVPQGNTLVSGTLRENLTRFTDQATDEEIRAAAEAACIDGLVDEIGLEARIGERGIGLSEGQAQRVAVARALLSGAPILLLDEATSALDEETEARMLENIEKMREKTVIIVTHRPAALGICNERWDIER